MLSHASKRKLSQRSVSLSRVQDAVQTGGDVYWDKVVFATHCDSLGTDITGKTITSGGNIAASATQSMFGGKSLAYDGAGDYFTLDGSSNFAFGTGDFTIEMWFRPTTLANAHFLLDFRPASTNGLYPTLTVNITSGTVNFWSNSGTTTFATSTALVAGTWAHIAVCRSGTTTRVFINGVISASGTDTNNYAVGTNRPMSGQDSYLANGTDSVNGYLDDIRITKGVARYTTNFAPPTTTFDHYPATYAPTNGDPYWTAVSFASHGDSVTYDITGKALTANGNATVSTAQSKFGGSAWYFDGTGDYITAPHSADTNLASSDWTIEGWLYATSLPSDVSMVLSKDGVYGTNHASYSVDVTSAGYVQATAGTGNGTSAILGINSLSPIALNTWYHFASVRSGSVLRLFVNGVLQGSGTITSCIDDGRPLRIGHENSAAGRYWNGYLDDIRITKGVARYVANFVPPVQAFDHYQAPVTNTDGDPYYGNVVFHSHFETLTDQKGHTFTAAGNAACTTTQPKFGAKSLALDGTGDWLQGDGSSDFTLGNGDFTVECWFRLSALGASQAIICWRPPSTNGAYPYLGISTSNLVYLYVNSADRINGTTTLAANTWYHVALCRGNGVTRIFLNGVQEGGSYADTNSYLSAVPQRPIIGAEGTSAANNLNGYIDELRITKGIARYTYNFTPPNAAFYDYSPATKDDPYYDLGTKLLMHFDGVDDGTTFIDSKGHTVTAAGNACTKIAQSKFGQSSLYLDGTGDYLTLDGSSDFAFGTGDFTIEFWIRPSSTGFQVLYDARTADGAYGTISLYSGVVQYYANTGWRITSTTTIQTATWYHVALTRSGTSTKLFINGTQEGSTYTDSTNYLVGAARPAIGCDLAGGNTYYGYIDDLRITKGYARYTANFTPHVSAHPG